MISFIGLAAIFKFVSCRSEFLEVPVYDERVGNKICFDGDQTRELSYTDKETYHCQSQYKIDRQIQYNFNHDLDFWQGFENVSSTANKSYLVKNCFRCFNMLTPTHRGIKSCIIEDEHGKLFTIAGFYIQPMCMWKGDQWHISEGGWGELLNAFNTSKTVDVLIELKINGDLKSIIYPKFMEKMQNELANKLVNRGSLPLYKSQSIDDKLAYIKARVNKETVLYLRTSEAQEFNDNGVYLVVDFENQFLRHKIKLDVNSLNWKQSR
jgi:hypothetical protein